MNESTKIKIGIIGGSGMEHALGIEKDDPHVSYEYPDTPFGKPSAPLTCTKWQGVDVVILKRHGEGHRFSPSAVPYRANIFALKMLGVTHIVASGATGSLREQIHPGDLVILDQVIDKTYKRANTFYEHAAVHVELADPFCPIMRQWLLQASKGLQDTTVHQHGCYVTMEGPAFSTRAESEMHRQWGADLVGMTCMPEVRLAREAEIAYAMIGLPTDYDCWREHDPYASHNDLLSQIIANLQKASNAGVQLIKRALQDIGMLETQSSPAHDALKLGIWSDKAGIDGKVIEQLAPLWGKYFK